MGKLCKVCDRVLELDEFHKSSRAKDGRQSRCKDCNKRQRSEYYRTANGKLSNSICGKRSRTKQGKFIYDYLSTHPCACGESDPVVLEFDHDDPSLKSFTVGSKIGRVSMSRLLEEINKCTVRCANCHRRRTSVQFNWYNQFMAL